ncbi:hypothetical protein BJ741DRAFT_193002 [Chytriomyces cf. hyalinus JEL632]|nr:hypothetical protein BJ741DRAFT_193002 [Chytriomyces cf. hyalinus JEL632]
MHINKPILLAWSVYSIRVTAQSLSTALAPQLETDATAAAAVSPQLLASAANAESSESRLTPDAVRSLGELNSPVSEGDKQIRTDKRTGAEVSPTATTESSILDATKAVITETSDAVATSADASVSDVDVLSIISVIANLMPTVVDAVFTISSMAASSDPCANVCLSTIGNVSDPTSLVLFCKNSDQIETCKSECPANSYLDSLISACDRAVPALGQLKSASLAGPAPPSPAASGTPCNHNRVWVTQMFVNALALALLCFV